VEPVRARGRPGPRRGTRTGPERDDDLRRVASGCGRELPEPPGARRQLIGVERDGRTEPERVPAVGDLHDAAERGVAVSADPDRDVRLLDRMGPHAPGLADPPEAPLERDARPGPDLPHEPERLDGAGGAVLEGHAEGLELLPPPADARAEDHAPAREIVRRGERPRREHGVPVGDHEDARAHADPPGDAGEVRHRREGFEPGLVRPEREGARGGVGIGCRAGDRDEHAVGDEHRVVAKRLGTLRQRGDRPAVRQRPAPRQREPEPDGHPVSLRSAVLEDVRDAVNRRAP
jgi:hypothetical protein